MAAPDAVIVAGRVGEDLLSTDEAQPAPPMDETTFRLLYDRFAHPLAGYVRRLTGDRSLAEDILQEVFLRLSLHPVGHLNESQMKAYLYKIATRLVYDHWRRLKRERQWSFIARTGWQTDIPVAGTATSTRYGVGPILGADMERVFHKLKPQERALLWLAYVEDCKHSEVAQVLGLKEKSVRVLLFRARKKLSRMLKKVGLASEVTS